MQARQKRGPMARATDKVEKRAERRTDFRAPRFRSKRHRVDYAYHPDDPRGYCHCQLLRRPIGQCETGKCFQTTPPTKDHWASYDGYDPEYGDVTGSGLGSAMDDGNSWAGRGRL